NKKNGERYRERQTAEKSACKRCIALASFAQLQCHRQQTDDRGQRSHKYRTKADTTAQGHSFTNLIPWLHNSRVNSTIRMLLETAMPVNMTTPISDMTFSVVPVIHRVRITPVTPGGTASRIRSGSITLRN